MPTSEEHTRTRLMTIVATMLITSMLGALGWSLKTIREAQDERIDELVMDVDSLQILLHQSTVSRAEYDNDIQQIFIRLNRMEDRIIESARSLGDSQKSPNRIS